MAMMQFFRVSFNEQTARKPGLRAGTKIQRRAVSQSDVAYWVFANASRLIFQCFVRKFYIQHFMARFFGSAICFHCSPLPRNSRPGCRAPEKGPQRWGETLRASEDHSMKNN